MKVALSRGKVQELYVAILLSWNRTHRDDMLNAETFYVLQLIQDSALMVIFPVFFFFPFRMISSMQPQKPTGNQSQALSQ